MMVCREVRDRLVAWQDGELSPGETAQVREHLLACEGCLRRERLLASATPDPSRLRRAPVPDEVLASLGARLDADALLAAAAEASPGEPRGPGWAARALAWSRREAQVPRGLVVAYVAVLCAALGFAVSGWWSAPSRPAPSSTVSDVQDIPADQFRPASYAPAPTDGDDLR